MATILVVDDEPHIIELMRDWLTLHRYTVLTALDGAEGIQLAEAHHPDLILLDVMMPHMDGIEVCKRLRSTDTTADIPIIIVSGRDPAGGRAEGLMAGANDYVTKPVNLEDLSERLHALLTPGDRSLDRSERLLHEAAHAALSILPCNLAWVLTISSDNTLLVSHAVAAAGGDQAAARFLRIVAKGNKRYAIQLSTSTSTAPSILIRTVFRGTAEFNVPLAVLREQEGDEAIFRACQALDLYYVTVAPLQVAGSVLGVVLFGSVEPRDVDTTRGQQLLAAVVSQIATAVDNTRLVSRLLEREAVGVGERAFHQMVLDTMTDGILLYDAQGRVRFANQRLAQMTGFTTEALTSLSVEDLCTPDDRERMRVMLGDSQRAQTTSFEIKLLCADGRPLPALAIRSGKAVSRVKGIYERVIVLRDLSEHRAQEQVLAKRSDYLAALNRAAQAINSSASLDEALQVILTETNSALGSEVSAIILRPPGADELFCHSAVGTSTDQLRGQRISISQSIAGYVVREGLPVLVDDVCQDERFAPALSASGVQMRAVAAVPLIVQDEAVGALEVIGQREGMFDLDDLEVLQGLARSAAVAIENASLFEETRRQVRELKLLLQASEAASSTLALETVLETIARQLIDALDVTWCIISSWEREDDSLVKLAEVAEIVWEGQRGRVVALGDYPLTQQALAQNRAFVTGVDAPGVEPVRRQALLEANYWSVLCVPIAVKGQVVGLAEIYHSSSQTLFSETDLDRCLAVMAGWRNAFPIDLPWSSPECLQALGRELLGATAAAWCTLMAHEPELHQLRVLYETGQAVWPIGRGESHPLDDASLRRIALMERTAVAMGLDDPHLSPADRSALPRLDKGAMLAAPLIVHGEAIGLVQLIDIDPRRSFTESELSLAQAIANVVGSALENSRLYSALARRAAQLEAAYNDLRDADRTTDEMIQNISHELRTPLAPIIGYTDMLLAGDLGSLTEEQRRVLEIIATQGRLLTRMVSGLLVVQNVPQEPLERRLGSLSALADSAIQSIALEAAKHKVEFITDFPRDLPDVLMDEERILQVFESLLDNAIKFSPNGGAVLVAIKDIGHSLQVDIADQGIGIPPTEHERIWRRFYQVDGSTTRAFNGLGLGLTIVKQVIERHEGRVWVTSEPGKGSTFSFTLPKIELMES